MGFVFLVFAIGVLNLALGYALAVHLGFGATWLTVVGRLLRPARPIGRMIADMIGRPGQEPQPAERTAGGAAAALPPRAEETPDVDLEPELVGLDGLGRIVAMSISSLAGFAARLKKSQRGDHGRTGWAFVTELQGICQPYLEKLQQATQRLADEVGSEVQDLVLEQLAQLETTLGNLQYMDFGADAEGAAARLTRETANTLSTARKLQQAIEAACAASGQVNDSQPGS